MIRRAITIVGLAVSLGISLPAGAVPILDLETFENREVVASRYGQGMGGTSAGVPIGSESVFTSDTLIIGTGGNGEFIDAPSDAIASSFLEPASFGEPGSGANSTFLDTTTLSGNSWACGQPGYWFSCLELVLFAPNKAVTTPGAADSQDSSDQNVGDANGATANRRLMRPLTAAMPMAFVLLTSGLAAVGIAGWQTIQKSRRARRRQRRRRLGLYR
jgi:hypothetical protein